MDDRRLNGLTHVIYEAAMHPTLWASVMADITESFGARAGTLLPTRRPTQILVSAGMEAAQAAYTAFWWQRDPLLQPQFLRLRGLVKDWDLIPQEDRRRDAFYQEFKRGHGLGEFVVFNAEPEPGDLFCFGCHLPFERTTLPDELTLSQFESVCRHMIRAVAISGRLFPAGEAERGIEAVLSTLQHGVALLDGQGNVREANAAFERLASHGLSIEGRRLRTARMRDQLPLDRLLARALGRAGGGPDLTTVASRFGGPPLLVRAMPLPQTERIHAALPAEIRILVLVIDPAAASGADAAIALRHLGLTAAEARVAALVGAGVSAPEIAAKLGTSQHTVRTQTKAAMAKLEFKRQSELVTLVTRLAGLGADG